MAFSRKSFHGRSHEIKGHKKSFRFISSYQKFKYVHKNNRFIINENLITFFDNLP